MLAATHTPQGKASGCLEAKVSLESGITLGLERSLEKTKIFAASLLLSISLAISVFAPLAVQSCNCSEVKVPPGPSKETDGPAGYKWSLTPAYTDEFHKAIESAKQFCLDYKKKHPDQMLTVVSDIDETVLDNRECLKTFSKDDWTDFFKWIQEARAPKLKESAEFIQWAHDNGFYVFFITGRHEKDRGFTIINLHRQGLQCDGLYLRTPEDNRPAEIYKTEVREKIEKMGFTIVESIGDQFSDLAGGHAADCQKLPNHMYFIR